LLVDDYEDAHKKLEKVLYRCQEYGVVLKMKKSWIGVDTVTLFGFEVTHGKWKLSDSCKQAIAEMPFPTTTKSMQFFPLSSPALPSTHPFTVNGVHVSMR